MAVFPENALKTFLLRTPYRRTAGPEVLGQTIEEIEAMNCQALVHAVLKRFVGESLEPDMKSQEIFQDEDKFRTLGSKERLDMWDVVCFGTSITKPKELHMGIVIGVGVDGELVIRHSSNRFPQVLTEGVADAALSLVEYLYGGVRATKRLRAEPGEGVNLPIIEKFDQ